MRPTSLFRYVTALSILLLTFALSSAPALADSPAHQALKTSVERILNVIKDPAYQNQATRSPLRQKVEAEVHRIFDFSEFSMRTVGQRWKTFSADQQKKFSDAFADLLMTTYLSKIDGYNGEQVSYKGEISNPAGDKVEIKSELKLSSGKIIPVNYRMLSKNGGWVVYDVLVEGISLVKNYRTQFGEILQTASPDELISRIRESAAKARASNGR